MNNVISNPNPRMKPQNSITKQGQRGTLITGEDKTKRKLSFSDQSLAIKSSSVDMNIPEIINE